MGIIIKQLFGDTILLEFSNSDKHWILRFSKFFGFLLNIANFVTLLPFPTLIYYPKGIKIWQWKVRTFSSRAILRFALVHLHGRVTAYLHRHKEKIHGHLLPKRSPCTSFPHGPGFYPIKAWKPKFWLPWNLIILNFRIDCFHMKWNYAGIINDYAIFPCRCKTWFFLTLQREIEREIALIA